MTMNSIMTKVETNHMIQTSLMKPPMKNNLQSQSKENWNKEFIPDGPILEVIVKQTLNRPRDRKSERERASKGDWYNMKKSKHVKAFRYGESVKIPTLKEPLLQQI